MKSIRIVFSNYDDIKNPYYGGGGAFSIHEVSKRLAKKFHVTVLTGNYPGALKRECIDGVVYERIGLSFLGPKISQFCFHFFLWKEIWRRSFDVWIESFTPPVSTSCLPVFTKKPVIGLVHMLSGADMRRKYLFPFDTIESLGLKCYRYCIVTSDVFCKKIRSTQSKMSVEVIPNGVDIGKITVPKKTCEYFLFFGRIEMNQKGVDLLLQAYAGARDSTDKPLVIAGFGTKTEMDALKSEISRLGLEDRVKLLGKIEGSEAKRNLFAGADITLITSRFETFSMVALESMASRTPIVAFDITGLEWIPDQAAIKIKPFEINEFSSAFTNLSHDSRKKEAMGKYGEEYASQFDWDSIASKYETYILSVVNSSK